MSLLEYLPQDIVNIVNDYKRPLEKKDIAIKLFKNRFRRTMRRYLLTGREYYSRNIKFLYDVEFNYCFYDLYCEMKITKQFGVVKTYPNYLLSINRINGNITINRHRDDTILGNIYEKSIKDFMLMYTYAGCNIIQLFNLAILNELY